LMMMETGADRRPTFVTLASHIRRGRGSLSRRPEQEAKFFNDFSRACAHVIQGGDNRTLLPLMGLMSRTAYAWACAASAIRRQPSPRCTSRTLARSYATAFVPLQSAFVPSRPFVSLALLKRKKCQWRVESDFGVGKKSIGGTYISIALMRRRLF
jgi:hypothetical protein